MKPSTKAISLLILLTILFQSCDRKKAQACDLFDATIEQVGNNVLKADASFGVPPYTYVWSTSSQQDEITVDSSGEYSVQITDAAGCVALEFFDYTYEAGCGVFSVTDADDNVYNVISIGSQCWMQENLRVTSGIAEVNDIPAWEILTTPAWCYYQNSSANLLTYGLLYNWAAINQGNLCPNDWHMATLDDWNTLINYLGGQSFAGGPMKSITGWEVPNAGATNSSGFTAFGSGYCGTNGAFWDEMKLAAFWTATEYDLDATQAWAVTLSYQYTLASAGWSPKNSGYSCRCVKD